MNTDVRGATFGVDIPSLLRVLFYGQRFVADILDLANRDGNCDRVLHGTVLGEAKGLRTRIARSRGSSVSRRRPAGDREPLGSPRIAVPPPRAQMGCPFPMAPRLRLEDARDLRGAPWSVSESGGDCRLPSLARRPLSHCGSPRGPPAVHRGSPLKAASAASQCIRQCGDKKGCDGARRGLSTACRMGTAAAGHTWKTDLAPRFSGETWLSHCSQRSRSGPDPMLSSMRRRTVRRAPYSGSSMARSVA
jgi:hypothetical protein